MKKIKIKDSFIVLLSILFLLDEEGVLFLFLLAAVAHELGHYFALRLCGGTLLCLELGATGAVMRYRAAMHSVQRLCIAAAGPMASFVCAAVAGWKGHYLFAGANVLLGAFNLLPIFLLDGWTVLHCLLAPWADRGEKLRDGISSFCVIAILAVGGIFYCKGWGIGVFGMGVILLFEQKHLQKKQKRDKIENIVAKLHGKIIRQCDQRGDADVLFR